jgi:hypothetical protein
VDSSYYNTLPLEPSNTILEAFTRLTLCRDFKAAQETILELDHLNPLHVFKIMRFHELRGDVSEAYRTAHSAVELFQAKAQSSGKLLHDGLFRLCEAYFRCFTQGRWAEAIARAIATLDEIASVSEPHLGFENVSYPTDADDNARKLSRAYYSAFLSFTLSRYL